MRRWADYKVDEPEYRPHSRIEDKKQFDHFITVRFFDEDGHEYKTIDYGYLTKDEVLNDIHAGKEINLSHCYVKGLSLGLSRKQKSRGIHVSVKLAQAEDSFFDGGLNFSGAVFEEERLSFKRSSFGHGNVSFRSVVFNSGHKQFSRTRFLRSNIDFSYSLFYMGDVSFVSTHFGSGFLNFSHACFLDGNIRFDRSSSEKGEVNFNHTSFGNGVLGFENAILKSTTLSFKHSKSGRGVINFKRLFCREILFQCSDVTSRIVLMNTKCKFVKLHDCFLSNDMSICGSKIDKLIFNDCINKGVIDVRWSQNALGPAIEANLDDKERTPAENHASAAETALLLKENFRKLGRYEDEDEAYHCYKRHQLRQQHFEKTGLKRKLDVEYLLKLLIFEKLGGYGTRPWNILKSIPLVMGFFALVNHVLLSMGWASVEGIVNRGLLDWKSFTCSLYYSAITFLTIGFGDLAPTSWLTRLLAGVEGLIGLLLVAYFTIAFSRKVLR